MAERRVGKIFVEELMVSELADRIVKGRVFNPVDDVDRRRVNAGAVDVIKEISGLDVDSVDGLERRVAEDRDKKEAKKALSILSKAVRLAMTKGDVGKKLKRDEVREVLPESWKGLENRVVGKKKKKKKDKGGGGLDIDGLTQAVAKGVTMGMRESVGGEKDEYAKYRGVIREVDSEKGREGW